MSDGVVLIGIPGSGKSTVAALVAAAWGRDLIDTDEQVAAAVGAALPELFATEAGQRRFQQEEQRLAVTAIESGAVVALGSAAVLQAAVREALIRDSTWWLATSVAVATRRLGLTSLGMETLIVVRKQLEADLSARSQWYEEMAGHRIDTDRLSAADIAATIIGTRKGQ